MGFYCNNDKTTLLILFLTTITIIVTTTATRNQLPPPPPPPLQPPPPPSPEQDIQGYLRVHNGARAEVGVGPLTWNETLAEYAETFAGQRTGDCALKHSGGSYGENLLWASWDPTGEQTSTIWADEKPNYDYANNTCLNGAQCLHYTQVVWRDTARIGCGKAKCDNGNFFAICSYDPPGNYIGQRPY